MAFKGEAEISGFWAEKQKSQPFWGTGQPLLQEFNKN
jgi:hypothetical protein